MNTVSRVRTNVTDRIDKFTISEDRVSAFRMHRHHLDLRAPSSRLPSVVGDVCGVQAQVTAMARIALWARLRQLTLDDVERALVRKRTIVKTWSMRGALHLLASNELLLYLRGLMPTRLPREQRWIEGAGLKEEETTAMILDALKNGPLTRVQLVAYLANRLGNELVEVDTGRRRGFLLRKDLPELEKAASEPGIVRLLPSFDPYLLGHRDRDHLVDRAHYKQVYKDQGWLAPVVLVDGRVAGTWSYERQPRTLRVDVNMFTAFSKETRTKAKDEAHDLSRFLEVPDLAVRFN